MALTLNDVKLLRHILYHGPIFRIGLTSAQERTARRLLRSRLIWSRQMADPHDTSAVELIAYMVIPHLTRRLARPEVLAEAQAELPELLSADPRAGKARLTLLAWPPSTRAGGDGGRQ